MRSPATVTFTLIGTRWPTLMPSSSMNDSAS